MTFTVSVVWELFEKGSMNVKKQFMIWVADCFNRRHSDVSRQSVVHLSQVSVVQR